MVMVRVMVKTIQYKTALILTQNWIFLIHSMQELLSTPYVSSVLCDVFLVLSWCCCASSSNGNENGLAGYGFEKSNYRFGLGLHVTHEERGVGAMGGRERNIEKQLSNTAKYRETVGLGLSFRLGLKK